jgi:hypothetical protein
VSAEWLASGLYEGDDKLSDVTFTEPTRPDVSPLDIIHRGHNRHVPVYTVTDGEFGPAFALPAWSLKETAEHMTATLEVDSYAAINGFWTDSSYRNDSKFKAGCATLPRPKRKKEHLHYINAVFLDIDCHNIGLTPGQAIGHLIDAQDMRLVPKISIITKSGRGVWAYWLLKDGRPEHSHHGVRANRVSMPWTEAIQRELQRRFAPIGADAQAIDLCRVTRIPGSINSKSDSRVEYWVRSDSNGSVAAYTLEQFGEFIGVAKPEFRQPTGKLLANGLDPKRTGRMRWDRDVERMILLLEHRGIIREGQRGAAVFLFSTFLKRCGFRGAEFRKEVERIWPHLELASGEKPGLHGVRYREYSRREFERQLSTNSDANPSHRQIASMLAITVEESRLTGWPSADAEPVLSRATKQQMRRAILTPVIQSGVNLSIRKAIELVATTDGRLGCATDTMTKDIAVVKASVFMGCPVSPLIKGEAPETGTPLPAVGLRC